MRRRIAWSGVILLSLAVPAAAAEARQNRGQPLSPPAKASCQFTDGKTVDISYSSPRTRGRKIFGGLVPYGEVWRVGANEATTFDTTADLVIGGKAVPAGNYTLFAVPTPGPWTLIISKKTGEWGIPYPGASYDFLRVPMSSTKLPSSVVNFTITLVPGGTTCAIEFDWETTRASITIHEQK